MTNINTKKHIFHLCSYFYFLLISQILATADNTITITNPLTISKTLVSQQKKFELGFFTPGGPNSDKWYVGIWYKEIKETTIVWVANRENPVTNSSSPPVLKITQDGRLVIDDRDGNYTLSLNSANNSSSSTTTFIAKLLDSGNFVVLTEKDEIMVWQSFDYPTDTLLPGMKLGWDSKTGFNRNITSWKSPFDPSPGNYTFKLDVNGLPEAYLTNRDTIFYRSGPWNGVGFSGVPEMKPTDIIVFEFQMNKDEVYYTFEVLDKKICSRLLVKHNGFLERYTWIPTSNIWNKFWYAPKDQCDLYEECGVSGICNANLSPVCKCLVGYKPKNQVAWDLRDGSDGCVRYHDLDCETDVFNILKNMKLPQSSSSFVDTKMNLEECEKMCRYNCSCTAYTTANVTGSGSGCVIWTKELVDMRQYSAAEGGQFLYVRAASSDAAKSGNVGSEDGSGKTKRIALATGITAGVVLVLIGVVSICFLSKRKKLLEGPIRKKTEQRVNTAIIPSKREISGETVADEFELPLFDLSTLAVATEDFSDVNKLGQGGFGCVYKGIIDEGQEIAVKRLSKNSGQGVEEFKNELRLIARLQHRNLVRLLGCCVEMEEKMLIYEYMENKSLDSILFSKSFFVQYILMISNYVYVCYWTSKLTNIRVSDKQKSSLLDWQRRFSIICGIARGLLYLHQDSRFRIIHRDLKASNILLDKEMIPKISDFGMARIFGGDETEGNTKRVVGTYGYMSPEYAMDGLFSAKSDVFSFGVLVLEIVTGKKNRGFYFQNNERNLLGHAWKLWREGGASDLLDSSVGESFSPCEVIRCIQVGLLCVQEQAEDRPNMATVVLMLGSETATMPQPKHPGFCLGRRPVDEHSETIYEETFTVNQVTITMLDPRIRAKAIGVRLIEPLLDLNIMSKKKLFTIVLLVVFVLFYVQFCTSNDTISFNKSLKDGDLLVSSGKLFALGFFSPGNYSNNRYVGIWYNNIPELTVVWVANRENPVNGTYGVLSIDPTGNLVILNRNTKIFAWKTNISSAQLLDSGNFVFFRDTKKEVIVWQSFDHPTNTILPDMKFGIDKKTGFNRSLTSWKSMNDPGSGEYVYKIEINGIVPQVFLYKNSNRIWRTGPWTGLGWSGVPGMRPGFIFNIKYVDNESEVSVIFTMKDPVISRLVLNESGMMSILNWHEGAKKWVQFWSAPEDSCDDYVHCGKFSNCNLYNLGEFECKCLIGYEPRENRSWYLRDGSQGCLRKEDENVCKNGEGFAKLSNVKVPDTYNARLNRSIGLQECEKLCLNNCSCSAYASANVSIGGIGCITWYGDLIDTREFTDGGQDLYIRVSASTLAQFSKNNNGYLMKRTIAIVTICIGAILIALSFACCLVIRKRRRDKEDQFTSLNTLTSNLASYVNSSRGNEMDGSEHVDVLIFDLSTIISSTDDFSDANKLGEGGFGTAKQWARDSGQKTFKNSGQGVEEFKNEVTLIARVQHRNLVRLLGCCIQRGEKMLIYEYLPNKGLDSFIFGIYFADCVKILKIRHVTDGLLMYEFRIGIADKTKGSQLDWRKRFEIIVGIARGLSYLHHDSRVRIIHRDLKASNVLLDTSMHPKISDFGTARIFGGDQVEANTNRVWDSWNDDKALDVVDPSLGDWYESSEVLRCIQIGLLCVQSYANERPMMSQVVFMLCNETKLSNPGQPGFVFRSRNSSSLPYSSSTSIGNSVNDISITAQHAR
ncbi:hypothetical protein H5410_013850 [Solanum commersonii]|uniref:non-specific serine/threonine protein kinase n=1 Tax=Solanum commersonii TaxID=4109 RepID=A0A9J5ZPM3_SOLCO|nr:hypothetical protein H5410_013850 [Solanum commersonii]